MDLNKRKCTGKDSCGEEKLLKEFEGNKKRCRKCYDRRSFERKKVFKEDKKSDLYRIF